MNTQRAAHSAELTLANGNAPEWIHLLPQGCFAGRDGRGPYELANPDEVIRATMTHFGSADLPMDYDHQLEHVTKNGMPAPASGWVKALEARADGIWARVEWTVKAANHVAAREYRYVSPVFYHDSAGRIGRIESVALTNQPNLTLKALSSTIKESRMDMKTLASILGAPPDTTPVDLEARLKAALAERDSATATIAEVGKAAQAVSAGATDVLKAVQAVAHRASSPDPARFVPMDVYSATSRELAEIKVAQAANTAALLVDEAGKAGKVTPAMEAWAKDYASTNPEGFKTWAAAAPDMRPGTSGAAATPPASVSGGNEGELNASQKAVCAAMGFNAEDFKKAGVTHA